MSVQKYPDGDCRRLGPNYKDFQRDTRERVALRTDQNELAKKKGFTSWLALLFRNRTEGDRKPKHPWRSAAFKGITRAREQKRLAERAEKAQAANG